MSSMKPLNSRDIAAASQIGAAMTGDLEEILLHDTTSLAYKDHIAMLAEEAIAEADLETIAMMLQQEAARLDKFEQQELDDEAARAAERDKQRAGDSDSARGSDQLRHELHPAKQLFPRADALALLQQLPVLSQQIVATRQALQQVTQAQAQLQTTWQTQQTTQATTIVNRFATIVTQLPNGKVLPATHAFKLDPASQQAKELHERLAATPLLATALDKLENAHVRIAFDEKVKSLKKFFQAQHPQTPDDDITLAAKQQAVYDLNLDVRQLRDKIMMSVVAIHDHMKASQPTLLDHITEQYHLAQGITLGYKGMNVFKILERSISPLLTPTLSMANRQVKSPEQLDHTSIQVQALKLAIQRDRLRQQELAKLSLLRSLRASLRMIATDNPSMDFLHHLCDRMGMQPEVPRHRNTPRLVPKGYIAG